MGAQLVINKDNTQTWLDHFKSATSQALDEIGMIAEGYAKRKCPVDTGNLRSSITHQVDYQGKKVYVGTNVEYAPYVEMGTSKQTAQPYLRPAAQEHSSTYKAILKMHLQNG